MSATMIAIAIVGATVAGAVGGFKVGQRFESKETDELRVALAESAARFERNAAMRQAAGTIAGAGFQKWRLRQPELGIDTSKLPKRRDGSTPSTAGSPVFTGVQPGWTNIPDNYT